MSGQKLLRVEDYKNAVCTFYALDPWLKDAPLIAGGVVSTFANAANQVLFALLDGRSIRLVEVAEDAPDASQKKEEMEIRLRLAQRAVEIEIPAEEDGEPSKRRYHLSYERKLVRLPVGTEVGLIAQDATVDARYGRFGYLVFFPDAPKEQRQALFFHMWGCVTGLPARREWTPLLWTVGLKMGLIKPLSAYNCKGWRIDPRRDLPDGKPGWSRVLQLIVTTYA